MKDEDVVKPGWKTTEFWLSGLTVFVLAVLAVFVGYGVVTSEQAELWANLIVASLALLVPIAMAYVTARYSASRAEVKSSASYNIPRVYIEE